MNGDEKKAPDLPNGPNLKRLPYCPFFFQKIFYYWRPPILATVKVPKKNAIGSLTTTTLSVRTLPEVRIEQNNIGGNKQLESK